MDGITITEDLENPFTYTVKVMPELVSSLFGSSYELKIGFLAKHAAEVLEGIMIPLHSRLFPLSWIRSSIERYLAEMNKHYLRHHVVITFKPSYGSMEITMCALGENDIVLSPQKLVRPVPMVTPEEPEDDVTNADGFSRRDWSHYGARVAELMGIHRISNFSLSKKFGWSESSTRLLITSRHFRGAVNNRANFDKVLAYLESLPVRKKEEALA